MENLFKHSDSARIRTDVTGRAWHAIRLLGILTLGIMVAESHHYIDFPFLPSHNETGDLFMHSILTTVLAFPLLYFLAYRPLLTEINHRQEAEQALRELQGQTEQRVKDRTADLLETNLALKDEIQERELVEAALANQNLELQSLTQMERQQRRLAESLVQSALALNTTLEMNAVLDRILEQIQSVIPCAAAAIFLIEDGKAWLVRLRGVDKFTQSLQRMETGVPLEDLPQLRTTTIEQQTRIVPGSELPDTWHRFPDLDWIKSLVLAPLFDGNRVLGAIVLADIQTGQFVSHHTEQLTAFSSHAVLAIQNARLFSEVEGSRERLQALARRLVEVQEDERKRVARELHDEAGQALTALKVGLRLLGSKTQGSDSLQSGLEEMNRTVDRIMASLHEIAVDLRPTSLDQMGLVYALEQIAENAESNLGIKVAFEKTGIEDRLPIDYETALYRIVQEALTNVARHAQAHQAGVVLQRKKDKIILTIEDDGIGFEPGIVQDTDHLGIFGIQERVEMLGGSLNIESQPNQGTTIYVEVPYGH